MQVIFTLNQDGHIKEMQPSNHHQLVVRGGVTKAPVPVSSEG